MPSPFPLVFKALARLPLPVLHNLGALAGWLAWLLSATYRRNFRRHIEQAGGSSRGEGVSGIGAVQKKSNRS